MKTTKIVLLGYMGSGKTAVGFLLNNYLKYKFWDLDHYLEAQWETSVSDIFKSKGELYFREQERNALEHLLKDETPMVISLGGGTPCYYDTMSYLGTLDHVVTVYLKTQVLTLSQRLFNTQQSRPLIAHLKGIDQIQEFVGKHLFERNVFYSQADYLVETDKKTVEIVTAELAALLA